MLPPTLRFGGQVGGQAVGSGSTLFSIIPAIKRRFRFLNPSYERNPEGGRRKQRAIDNQQSKIANRKLRSLNMFWALSFRLRTSCFRLLFVSADRSADGQLVGRRLIFNRQSPPEADAPSAQKIVPAIKRRDAKNAQSIPPQSSGTRKARNQQSKTVNRQSHRLNMFWALSSRQKMKHGGRAVGENTHAY